MKNGLSDRQLLLAADEGTEETEGAVAMAVDAMDGGGWG